MQMQLQQKCIVSFSPDDDDYVEKGKIAFFNYVYQCVYYYSSHLFVVQ